MKLTADVNWYFVCGLFAAAAWYPIGSGYGVGVNNIILLADLNDASKGYLVNDAIIFEAEMVKVSITNIVSA